MLFSDLYKSPRSPLSKLRSSLPHATPVLPPDYDADLVSKDKAKQKEAVKRFLAEKIRNDWEFTWPPEPVATSEEGHAEAPVAESVNGVETASPDAGTSAGSVSPSAAASASVQADNNGEDRPATSSSIPKDGDVQEGMRYSGGVAESISDADSDSEPESETGSVYSTVSEDAVRFRNRAEWTSDLSDDDLPRTGASPFRFDSPDSVGTTVQASIVAAKARRRRELREEATWNDGLACFMARRDAWTGARTVRVKPKPPSAAPPSSPRRLFWRSHSRTESGSSVTAPAPVPLSTVKSAPAPTIASPLSPITTHHSHHSQSVEAETITPPPSEPDSSLKQQIHALCPVETILPVPPPLIPAQNPMRASVTPSIYPSLYDKVVVSGLQPSCPINLGDMLRACVVGWKRDGEWPPRPAEPVPLPSATAAAVVVVRRRKEKHASTPSMPTGGHGRKGSTAGGGSTRRMSFGGFLERVSGDRDKEREKEGKENNHNKDNEEEVNSATGKGIRRSLQKVLGLGHSHGGSTGTNNPTAPLQPADEKNGGQTKEVTAAS